MLRATGAHRPRRNLKEDKRAVHKKRMQTKVVQIGRVTINSAKKHVRQGTPLCILRWDAPAEDAWEILKKANDILGREADTEFRILDSIDEYSGNPLYAVIDPQALVSKYGTNEFCGALYERR